MALRHSALFGILAGFVLVPQFSLAQSTRPESLAQGKIIITPRDAPDPHFANSVIVLAPYDQTGALGLNERRGDAEGPDFCRRPRGTILRPRVPARESHTLKHQVRDRKSLLGNIETQYRKALTDRPAPDIRIFAGYSGWAPGQLEREVRRHGSYIFNYDEALVFDDHPETLWDRMITKTDRRLAWQH